MPAQTSAFWHIASMGRAYLKFSRHLSFFSQIVLARGALLDMYFGQCSYYHSLAGTRLRSGSLPPSSPPSMPPSDNF